MLLSLIYGEEANLNIEHSGISLFTGAMGLDLGMEASGIVPRVCVENNPICVQTIKLNRPRLPVIAKSIEEVNSKELLEFAGLKKRDVFIMFGGPPCQAFSTAGNRESLQDTRGNCLLEFIKKVREIEPRYFVMENVRGLLSASIVPKHRGTGNYAPEERPGSVLKYILSLFRGFGYTVSFALFNSANYGVPQARERIIFFGSRGESRIPLPRPTHTEDGKLTGKKWATLKEAIGDLRDIVHHHVEFPEKRKRFYRMLKPGQYWRNLPLELQEEAMGSSYHLGGGKTGFYRRLSWDKPSPTLVTRPNMPATDLSHPSKLRPLSVEEYRAIQQFPSSWQFAGNIAEQYRQIGNAVPVGMGYAVGRAIVDFHGGKVKDQDDRGIKYSRYNDTTDIDFKERESNLFPDIRLPSLVAVH